MMTGARSQGSSAPSTSSIGCNSAAEPSDICRTSAGVDFLNTTSAAGANARNIVWDQWSDAGMTQEWACTDTSFTSCTCHGAFCSSSQAQPLIDDADAVYLTTNTSAKPFDVRGGSGFASACN